MICIFTKPVHVEKITNYLNRNTKIKYIISTDRREIQRKDFDIGISYCFPYIIDLQQDPMRGIRKWFNYHPGPLPKYPGPNNYIDAINDRVNEYGVTLHRMTQKVDSGEVIKTMNFKLASEPIIVSELGSITHYYLFQLFKTTIEIISE